MSTQHSAITDPNIHEPKGLAASDQYSVYVSNGDGTGTWALIDENSLNLGAVSSTDSFGTKLYRGVYATNNPSETLLASQWTQRIINSTITNEISASLSSNRVTLGSGTYFVDATTTATCQNNINGLAPSNQYVFVSKLYNATDSADILMGVYDRIITNSTVTSVYGFVSSRVTGRFTLSSTKAVDLRSYCNLGSTGSMTDISGTPAITNEINIWKIA